MGWGSVPYLSEYDSAGNKLFAAILPGSDLSYRARLEPWVGQPLYPPAGAARRRAGVTTVYASWNGATQVASWTVLAGSTASALATVGSQGYANFETAISVKADGPWFAVTANDAQGHVLGQSATVKRT
jgi:hypothetical protein